MLLDDIKLVNNEPIISKCNVSTTPEKRQKMVFWRF